MTEQNLCLSQTLTSFSSSPTFNFKNLFSVLGTFLHFMLDTFGYLYIFQHKKNLSC